MCINKIRVNPCQSTLFTSQCGRKQEVGSVFSDNVVSDGAETGPPAQLPNGLEELGVQRQGKAIVLLSLQGQAVHLPAAKLPAMSHKQKLNGGKGQTTYECCMQAHLFYAQVGRKLHVNSYTVSDQSLSEVTAIWKLLWDTSIGNTIQRLNPLSWTEHLFWVLEKKEKGALCCDFKVDRTQLAPHEEAHTQICSLPGIKYDVSTTSKWISCATP